MVVSLFSEKRDVARVRSFHLLSYSVVDEQNRVSGIGMAKTLNISEEGLLFVVKSPIEQGSTLELMLNLENECITVRGTVIRKRNADGQWLIGVKFTHLDWHTYRLLNRYLDEKFVYPRQIH